MVKLELQELSCHYKHFCAVDSVNLSIQSSGIYTLLGSNGCGKSTLLRAICGLQPFTGNCQLNQTPINRLSIKQRAQQIAYVGQNSNVNLQLPAIEIVALGFYPTLHPFEKLRLEHYQQALNVMQTLSIAHFAQQDFLTLSGGQQQLVLFARTMVRTPSFIVLDEPDSALDFENHHLMFSYLVKYTQNHPCLVLLCTHNPSIALQYSDFLVLMKERKLLEQVNLHQCTKEQLEKSLQKIYGNIELIAHKEKYIMVGRDCV